MTARLLPPNASALERDAEDTCAARCEAVPVPARSLWDPDTCPAHLLPWLAWALSVDVWDADWAESTKRAVVAASMDVHRIKGTVASVKSAVGAVETALTVREWWQYGGEPYTARLEARLSSVSTDGSGVTPETLAQLTRIVDETAPVRVEFELLVGVDFRRPQGVAGIARQPDAWLAGHWRQDTPAPDMHAAAAHGTAGHWTLLAPVALHLRG